MKLETSKLVYGYILASPVSWMKNTPIGGLVRVKGRIFKFWDPLKIKYGKGEARNFKFGIRIDLGKSHLTAEKYPHRGRGKGPGPNF